MSLKSTIDLNLPTLEVDDEAQTVLSHPMSPEEFLRWLESLPQPTRETLEERDILQGPVFRL